MPPIARAARAIAARPRRTLTEPRPPLTRRLLTEPRRPPAVRESARAHWYVIATVCVGAFMGQLDASIVTLALPRLGHDLSAGIGMVEWVALAYLLTLIGSVGAIGHLADRVGRKLLYVYGFAVFGIGSALCGLAPSIAVLIAARVLQGVGAAMLQANSVALIADALPRPLLARGLGLQGTAQALGLALGPAIGGILLTIGGWRLIFLVNVPAAALGLTAGWLLLPRSRTRTGDAPLIVPALLRQRALIGGLGSGLIAYMALFGTLFVVPYHLAAQHVATATAGLELAVLPAAIAVAAPLAGHQVARRGSRLFTASGLLLAAAGMATAAAWHGVAGLLAGLALTGIGVGAFTPANNAAIMAAAPPGRTGVISGVLNMTRGLGTALGVAVASAIYAARGFTTALIMLTAMAAATGLTLARRRSRATAD